MVCLLVPKGGGWCYNETLCTARSKGGLGSSAAWPAATTCYGQCDGILSADPVTNPDFHDWNAVFVGYCDGTSMAGARNGTHAGLRYRGRRNRGAAR